MSEEQKLAESYRIRAEGLRIIAGSDDNRQSRGALIEIAKDYDRMADTMDAIDRTNKKLSSGNIAADQGEFARHF